MASIFEKGKEFLFLQNLSSRYQKERKAAGLEMSTPFESTAFLSAMVKVIKEIGPDITNYHLISDEISAHIPTEILRLWQGRVRQEKPEYDHGDPGVSYIAGSSRYSNNSQILEYLRQNQEAFQVGPNLFVTDFLDTGDSFAKMKHLFAKMEIPFDAVVLSFYESLKEYDSLLQGIKVFFGETRSSRFQKSAAGSAVIQKSKLVGLRYDSRDPSAHPTAIKDEYRNRQLEELVQQQTNDFVRQLSMI